MIIKGLVYSNVYEEKLDEIADRDVNKILFHLS